MFSAPFAKLHPLGESRSLNAESTAGEKKGPNHGRRLIWLGLFVALLFGGYSAGWFYFASQLEEETVAAIAEMNEGAVSAECANPAVRGFPFRLGLHCDRIGFSDAARGVGMAAGGFRSAGQVYDLTRLVAELDGPALVDLPEAAGLSIDWQALRGSARLAEPLPERLSVEGRALTAQLGTGAPLASLASFEAHMRPNGGDLDLAVRFEGLELDPAAVEAHKLPALSGHADLSITGGAGLASSGAATLRGQEGAIRILALSAAPNIGVTASGPFSVGRDGLLDAELTLTVRDPEGLSALLGDAFPEARQQISTSLSGLAALGTEPSLPLNIVRGRASLGFIPLGDVPPL